MTTLLDATTVPFSLSVLTATKGHASKRLVPDAHGRPIRDPQHSLSISAGRVEHAQVAGLAELATLLAGIQHNQALVHGIPKGSNPGDILRLVLAEKYTGESGTIARTLECMAYPPGVRLIMADYDPAPEAPQTLTSAHTLVEQLAALWPALADVGWLATTSTSSAIRDKKTQAWLKPPEGMHVYMLASGDVARFREIAKVKLWLAGTGYCKLASPNPHTGVSAILERCLMDLTVFSPERLDYVGGAIIPKNAPFLQDRPTPELHPGLVLNLDSFPDVTDDEHAEYTTRVAEARARIEPEQRHLVRTHIASATPAVPDADVEQEITARLDRAERRELDASQPLYFDNGTRCTAGTLTKAFDGKRLRDPLEPTYGPSQAVFHWRGGHWRIVSWAHGIKRVFRLARPVLEPPLPEDGDMDDLVSRVGPLPGTGNSETHTDTLLRLAQDATLLKTLDGQRYACVPVNGHYEVLGIGERGSGFREWLLHRFRAEKSALPSTTAITQAVEAIAAQARFEAKICEVYTRVAFVGKTIYLDLANDTWDVVEIDAQGWRIVQHPPIYFRRPAGILPLPRPDKAGTMKDFYALLPVPRNSAEAKLITAWTLGTLQPEGACAHLAVHGEQGTAKTTLTRMLRMLVDPNQAPARSAPKEEKDLILAARNGCVVGLENVSHLPDWLSDALCCISTGAGLGTRKLYTDDDEVIFAAKRPAILNGITEVCHRGDLLDRTLIITLPPIPKDQRREEREVWAVFHTVHPKALGALLTAASMALRNRDTLHFTQLPRLADFATWVEAAAPALGWKRGEFLAALNTNRKEATAIELEASPFSATLVSYIDTHTVEEMSFKDLLTMLTDAATDFEKKPRPKPWPKSPRDLTGHVKRLAPALRSQGWDVVFHGHTYKGSLISITRAPDKPNDPDDLHDHLDDLIMTSSWQNGRAFNGCDDPDDPDDLSSTYSVEKEKEEGNTPLQNPNTQTATDSDGEGERGWKTPSTSSGSSCPMPLQVKNPDDVPNDLSTSSGSSGMATPVPAFINFRLIDPFCPTCQRNVAYRTLVQGDGSEIYRCESCNTKVGSKPPQAPLNGTQSPPDCLPLPEQTLAHQCPQCGPTEWLNLVTYRKCALCGYKDGPTPQAILDQREGTP